MIEAKISITLKPTVADPQGITIKHALESLGYESIGNARIGKFIILQLDHDDEKKASTQVDEMCAKILANPVIEDYTYELTKK